MFAYLYFVLANRNTITKTNTTLIVINKILVRFAEVAS